MSEVRQLPSEVSSAGNFARRLLKAVGSAIQAPDGSVNAADFLADGDELATVDSLVEEAYNNLFLSTATWLLNGYERIYGLPVSPELSDSDRQQLLVAKARATRSASPSDILKAVTALSPAYIGENKASVLPAGYENGVYVFAVVVNIAAFQNAATWSAIERIVAQMKPAHMEGNVCINTSFACDDDDSLTDRDVIEL